MAKDKYEYIKLYFDNTMPMSGSNDIIDELNVYGQDGWKVVIMMEDRSDSYFLLTRSIKNSE